jgi:hypothetical protein
MDLKLSSVIKSYNLLYLKGIVMGAVYSIVEAQRPLVGGAGGHNFFVLEENGVVIDQINGLATGSDGNIKPIGYLPSDTLQVYDTNANTAANGNSNNGGQPINMYLSSEAQAVVASGSETQIMAQWDAALACANAINSEGLSYPIGGVGANSNSVASTLDACMGVYEPSIPGSAPITPGVGILLLTPSQIETIEDEYGVTNISLTGDNYVSSDSPSTSGSPSVTVTNGSGGTQVTTFSTSGSSGVADLTDYNAGGTQEYQQINIISSNGQLSSTISGTGDIIDLDGSSLALAASAQAAVDAANNAITVAASAALTLGPGATGNTVTINGSGASVNMSGADGAVGGDTVTFSGSEEQLAFSTTATVYVAESTQTSVTGTDGTLTTDTQGSGNPFQNTINWSTTGSENQVFNPGSGITSDFETFTGSNGTGTDTTNVLEFTNDTSQQQLFASLPSGDSEQINSYSGLNLGGTLGSTIWDQTAGTSQVETYNPSSGVSTELGSFTGLNGSGTDNYNIVDFTNDTSQYQQLTGLPSGDSEIIDSYGSPNASGTLTSTIWDQTAGTSQVESYDPTDLIIDEVGSFSGPNGTDTNTYNILNYNNDTSQYEQLTGLPSGTTENLVGYADANCGGAEKYTLADYTSDYSLLDLIDPTSGVNGAYQDFTDPNGTGTMTSSNIYNSNNTSLTITYDYNGNSGVDYDTFYSGSTNLGYGLYASNGSFAGTYNGLANSDFSDDGDIADDDEDFDPYDGQDDGDNGGEDGDAAGGGRFSGLGNTISSSNTTITLTDGESATITGSGNTVNAASNDTITMSDSGPNAVVLAGDNTSVTDVGTGDSYSVTGQNNYLNVSNATVQVADSVSVDMDGNSSTLAVGSNDSVTLDVDSYLVTATLSGSDSTIADNGFGNSIAIAGSSNTVDFSASSETLAGNLVTFNGTTEQIVFSGIETVTIQSGTQATIIGTDGTMTVNNDGSGGVVQNTIDWNSGGSEVQTFTQTAGGLTEDDRGYDGSDGSGNPLYEELTVTDGSGNITSTLSGQGAVSSLSNAAITLSDDATATLNGGSNTVTLGNGSTLNTGFGALYNTITLSGNDALLNDAGSGDSITLSGASDTAVLSGGNISNSAVSIAGTNATLEFTANSNDDIVFGSGASGTLKLDFAPGFSGTVAGLSDSDSIDLGNFLFSGAPTITNVTGSGAIGTATNVTVADGSQAVTLALLNQYANQFAVNASAYTLAADSVAATAGTVFNLAASH